MTGFTKILQSDHYKYAQRTKGNHDLKSNGMYEKQYQIENINEKIEIIKRRTRWEFWS